MGRVLGSGRCSQPEDGERLRGRLVKRYSITAMTTLEYSSDGATGVRPVLGRVAAWVNIAWAVGLVFWLIGTAQEYFMWSHWFCGTPAVRLERRFFALSPLMLGVPVAGWVTARVARVGQRWARGGCLLCVVAWGVTAAFIEWGWMIEG